MIVLLPLFFIFSWSCSDEDLLQDTLVSTNKPSIDISSENITGTKSDSVEQQQNTSRLPETENLPCSTGSKSADESGAKVWCWDNISVPEEGFFDNHKLFISSHCSLGMVKEREGRLYFKVNPTTPTAPATCGAEFNYRAEIREHPSDVDYPVGTEQWWGFDYKFGDDYVPDELPWILWQTHGSFSNPASPMTNLQLAPTNYNGSVNPVGELFVVNNTPATGRKFTPVGIIPKAGQTLKIVIHLVWGDEGNGLYEVWIDGVQVYRKQERTVYTEQPYGGYWKIGIYKWRWKTDENVLASVQRNISELNTSIGTLRTIMRKPQDLDYGVDAYSLVFPD